MDGTEKKKLTKFQKFVLTPIYGAVIVLLIFMVSLQIFAPEKSVKIFGFQVYRVSYTGSMEPMLNYNDLIIVRKYDFDKLKKGDIITFLGQTTDGRKLTITHEVWDIKEIDGMRMIQTKGINKPEPDYIPVTIDGAEGTNTYIGKYAFKSEFLGNLIAYLQSLPGLIAIVVNAACITGIYFLLIKIPEQAEDEKLNREEDEKLNREIEQLRHEIEVLEEAIRQLEEEERAEEAAKFRKNADIIYREFDLIIEEMEAPHSYERVHRDIIRAGRDIHRTEAAMRAKPRIALPSNGLRRKLSDYKVGRAAKKDAKLMREIAKLQHEIEVLEETIRILEAEERAEEAARMRKSASVIHREFNLIQAEMQAPHTYRRVHRDIIRAEREIHNIESSQK